MDKQKAIDLIEDERTRALASTICDVVEKHGNEHLDGWQSIYACVMVAAGTNFTIGGRITKEELHEVVDTVMECRAEVLGE